MDQQLFSRLSRVIVSISAAPRTRNSCNFCLDNSPTSPTLFVAVVHVARIVCSVVIFFPFSLFFSHSQTRVHIHTRRHFSVLADRITRVEVTRKGEPEGGGRGGLKMRPRATCARSIENAERIKFHRGKGREGISVFFPSSTSSRPPPPPCSATTSKTPPRPPFWRGTTNTAEN